MNDSGHGFFVNDYYDSFLNHQFIQQLHYGTFGHGNLHSDGIGQLCDRILFSCSCFRVYV